MESPILSSHPITPSVKRRMHRPRSLLATTGTALLLSTAFPKTSANENHRRTIDFTSNAYASPLLAASASSCDPNQDTLRLTLNTDAHSIEDNSWRLVQNGVVMESGAVESDDAVVEMTVCLDGGGVECWDFEMHDEFGDGLTTPHSESGGTPGSFTLHYNEQLIASHTAVLCIVDNENDYFNHCASEHGFEYCGLRICRVPGSSSISVSNLKGSQCNIVDRQCDEQAFSTTKAFEVKVGTDGYAQDISWDLRDSNGNLVISGGDNTNSGGSVTLAQAGSVEFDNYENFHSSVCLPTDQCYDFRAYDVYGDGISCGVDGSISISFPGGKTLHQIDDNVAKLQRFENGTKTMACMDKKDQRGIEKWSFCHVRVCQDGSVTSLEGNQCSFGDEVSIDPDATGYIFGAGMLLNSEGAPAGKDDGPCADKDCTLAQEFSITEPDLMTASFEDKEEDMSWAEYYHPLIHLNDKESNQGTEKPADSISPHLSSHHQEFKLSLEPFYVNLLAPDSPYKLQYYRPHQMSNAISSYLLSYLLTNIEGWKDDNAPLHFELACNKNAQRFGLESERVIKCEGDAAFPKDSLPDKRVMNDLIHQAFAGKFHEEFLEFMYVDYQALTKKEKKEQKMEAIKLQQNSEKLDDNEGKKDKKEKKEEKLKNKLKLDGLSKREKKKEIRNKLDGRHLRSGVNV